MENEGRPGGSRESGLWLRSHVEWAWKAMPLSSVDTIENNPEPTPADTEHAHDHAHAHEHAHDHEHSHGPVLNPDCTRELVLDVPAEDVSKSFRRVTKE